MKRLSRLTNILLHIQSRRVITSRELAEKFGVSQRTIYRDIQTLEEAGVPIIGEAGTGYSLMDQYRIPPVMFSEAELNALLTARQLIQNNPDTTIAENLDTLLIKVKAILKHSAKENVELLEERVFVLPNRNNDTLSYLSNIQNAILYRLVLRLDYHAIYTDTQTQRYIEPLAVYFTNDKWILIAHCRLRNALREFRLDRIIHLQALSDTFVSPEFSFEDYFRNHCEAATPY